MSAPTEHPIREGFAAGTSLAVAALMLVIAILSILQGISAVANDALFVLGPEYVYKFDTTTWGWIHIFGGVLLTAAALGLFAGTTWARVVAIVIAALSIITNFAWLPYYPGWAILIIALDVVVIWAVATWTAGRA